MLVSKRRKLAQSLGRPDLAPRELTRKQTYDAFDFEINLRKKCLAVLEEMTLASDEDPISENKILICVVGDRMWQRFGIEREDYNLAMAKFKLIEDEFVLKRFDEVSNAVSEELKARLVGQYFQNPQEDERSGFASEAEMHGADSKSFIDVLMGKEADSSGDPATCIQD